MSLVLFSQKITLIAEENPPQKIVIVEEELNGINKDGIGNLENLLRLVLINEEC